MTARDELLLKAHVCVGLLRNSRNTYIAGVIQELINALPQPRNIDRWVFTVEHENGEIRMIQGKDIPVDVNLDQVKDYLSKYGMTILGSLEIK